MKIISKNLKVSKIKYLCDLGDIETADGRKVKKNLLFRSSLLDRIDEESIAYLKEKLQISRIIDLRTPEEVDNREDVIIPDIEYKYYPLLNESDNPTVNKQNRKRVLRNLMKYEGGTKGFLKEAYRKLISSDLAIDSYRLMFNDLLKHPCPTLWHCTQGKDRTGIQTLIILSALGVDKKTIIDDYLAYNKARRIKNFFILFGVRILKFNFAEPLSHCIKARSEFLDAAYEELETKFGSFDNFWTRGLGFSQEDRELLKDLYLE